MVSADAATIAALSADAARRATLAGLAPTAAAGPRGEAAVKMYYLCHMAILTRAHGTEPCMDR